MPDRVGPHVRLVFSEMVNSPMIRSKKAQA
jgi:hypothetical protein